jgi:hypothetical protein
MYSMKSHLVIFKGVDGHLPSPHVSLRVNTSAVQYFNVCILPTYEQLE